MFDPSNASMYAPGTTVGGMPQAGGYMPNSTEMMVGNMRMQQDSRMQAYLLQQDARSQHMARMAANVIGGRRGGAAWMQANGQMAAHMAGMAVNNQAVAGLMGGSILDMYGGVNTALASSGATRLNMGGGGSTMYGGSGYINDQVSRITTMRMQENFYNERGGAWLHKTAGLDRSELGELTGYMGMGGAFGNLEGKGATLTRVNDDKDRRKQLAAAIKSGDKLMEKDLRSMEGADWTKEQNVVGVDKATTDAFNRKVEAGAKALGAMKDIFGAQGVPRLMELAKDIAGTDVTSIEGSREIVNRMGRIKSFAAMHGMSAEAVGLEQARISQGMGGGVYGATSSEIIQRSAQIAYDNGRKGGSPRTRDEVVGFMMAGVSSINTEAAADAQLVATDLIMKDTSLTAAQRKELKAGISGITNAGANMEARGVATASLREKIAAMKGRSMEDLMEAAGGKKVLMDDKANAQALTTLSTKAIQDRGMALATDYLGKSGLGEGAASNFTSMAFGMLGADNFGKVRDIMAKGGGKHAIEKVINDSALSDNDKKKLAESFDAARNVDAQTWKQAGMGATNLQRNRSLLAHNPSEAATVEKEGMLGMILAGSSFGTDYKGDQNNVMRGIIGGMMGEREVTDQGAFALMKTKDQLTGVGKFVNGKLQLDEAGLAAAFADDKLGSKMDLDLDLRGSPQEKAAELMKRFKENPGSMEDFLQAGKVHGMSFQRGKDDRFYMGADTDVAKAKEVMQQPLTDARIRDMLGKNYETDEKGGYRKTSGTGYRAADAEANKGYKDLTAILLGDADSVAQGKDIEKIQKRNDRLAKGGMGTEVLKALDQQIGEVSTWEDNKVNQDKLKNLGKERERVATAVGMSSQNPMEALGNRILDILRQIKDK